MVRDGGPETRSKSRDERSRRGLLDLLRSLPFVNLARPAGDRLPVQLREKEAAGAIQIRRSTRRSDPVPSSSSAPNLEAGRALEDVFDKNSTTAARRAARAAPAGKIVSRRSREQYPDARSGRCDRHGRGGFSGSPTNEVLPTPRQDQGRRRSASWRVRHLGFYALVQQAPVPAFKQPEGAAGARPCLRTRAMSWPRPMAIRKWGRSASQFHLRRH